MSAIEKLTAGRYARCCRSFFITHNGCQCLNCLYGMLPGDVPDRQYHARPPERIAGSAFDKSAFFIAHIVNLLSGLIWIRSAGRQEQYARREWCQKYQKGFWHFWHLVLRVF